MKITAIIANNTFEYEVLTAGYMEMALKGESGIPSSNILSQ